MTLPSRSSTFYYRSVTKNVVVSAFSAMPGAGSEPGVGWLFTKLCTELVAPCNGHVWLFTEESQADVIMKMLKSIGLEKSVTICTTGFRGISRLRNKTPRLAYLIWWSVSLRPLHRLAKSHKVDVYHHVTFSSEFLPPLLPKSSKGAVRVWGPVGSSGRADIAWATSASFGDRVAAAGQWLRRRLSAISMFVWSRHYDVIVTTTSQVLSEQTRHVLVNRLFKRVFSRPNFAVNRNDSGGARVISAAAAGRTLVGAQLVVVGVLQRRKRVDLAIEALADPRLRNLHLTIFGDGPDRQSLAELSRRLGIEDRVSFLGWRDPATVAKAVHAARALLHPSIREGSPWAVLEAIELGTPVVCFRGVGSSGVLNFFRAPGVVVEAVKPTKRSDVVRAFADGVVDCLRIEQGAEGERISESDLQRELAKWYEF